MSHDVYRVHELKHKLTYKIESIATTGKLFFLGTEDGKVIVYEVSSADGAQPTTSTSSALSLQASQQTMRPQPSRYNYDAQSIHIQTSKHKEPIRMMIPVPDKQLLIMLLQNHVVAHKLQAMSRHQLDCLPVDKMPEIGVVYSAADIVTLHMKRQRGIYSLAVLQKKKVTILEYRDESKQFTCVKEGLIIPEGAKTLVWAGKNLLIGFRKQYVLMNVTTGDTVSLYPTGRSNIPLLACLEPTFEILVGEDRTGLRAMQDGSLVPGAKGMQWSSIPTSVVYSHPFLATVHDTSTLEVRIPVFGTLLSIDAATGGGSTAGAADNSSSSTNADTQQPHNARGESTALCQSISLKHVNRVSSRYLVDLDMQTPGKDAPADALRKDILIAVNANNSIYLLEMIPVQEQALALAASRSFESAVTLCQLCPNEVPQATVNDIMTLYGLSCFTGKRFKEAMMRFTDAGTDPRFVISLFPDFLPRSVKQKWKSSCHVKALEPSELAECVNDALTAFLDYVAAYDIQHVAQLPERVRASGSAVDKGTQRPEAEAAKDEDARMIQVALSTATARSLVVLGREQDLLQYLSGTGDESGYTLRTAKPTAQGARSDAYASSLSSPPRGNGLYVALHDTESFLADNGLWVALAVLWRSQNRVELALKLLEVLAITGVAPPTPVISAASVELDGTPTSALQSSSALEATSKKFGLPDRSLPPLDSTALSVLKSLLSAIGEQSSGADSAVDAEGPTWGLARQSDPSEGTEIKIPTQRSIEEQLGRIIKSKQGKADDRGGGGSRGNTSQQFLAARRRAGSESASHPLTSEADRQLLIRCTGIVTLLAFLHDLDVNNDAKSVNLLKSYSTWMFANVPPKFSLFVLQPISVKTHYHELVQILQAGGSDTSMSQSPKGANAVGPVSADERVAAYLQRVLGADGSRQSDVDLHNMQWRCLCRLILDINTPTHDTRATGARITGVDDSPYRRQLAAFLTGSKNYNVARAADWLDEEGHRKYFIAERAIVYQRLHRHTDAIKMYVNEVNSMDDAQTYATRVSEDDEDAFKVLLELLLPPGATAANKRTSEALHIIKTCDGVEASTALPLLPDDVALSDLKSFLDKSLRDVHTKRCHSEIYANVLLSRQRSIELDSSRNSAKRIVIDNNTVCAGCGKKIRPDTVFARYPNGVLVHQACVEDEHVCPITFKDFRFGAELFSE